VPAYLLQSLPAERFPISASLEQIGPLLAETYPDFIVSKQKMRQAEAVQMVHANRGAATQNLGFASRPFVLCGLPVNPQNGTLIHEPRNGKFVLQVTGHPEYGLPWGQNRLVPLLKTIRAACRGETGIPPLVASWQRSVVLQDSVLLAC
jgi:hypothetical protein